MHQSLAAFAEAKPEKKFSLRHRPISRQAGCLACLFQRGEIDMGREVGFAGGGRSLLLTDRVTRPASGRGIMLRGARQLSADPLWIDELEKGFSAVKMALGQPPAPFFRFPQLQHNPAAMTYLGTRNVAMFSTDLDSFDFRSSNADQIVNTVMTKVDKLGKGIILMHDFQKLTGEALPTLLARLKAGGYKVVHMKAKTPFDTLPEYDAMMVRDTSRLPQVSSRPVSAVVQTVTE